MVAVTKLAARSYKKILKNFLYKKCKERLCLSCTRPCLCAFAFLCISGLKSGALRSSLIREFWNKKISWKFFVQEMQSISLNKKLRTKAQRNKEILKEFLVQETPKRFFECIAFLGHKNCKTIHKKIAEAIFCAQDPVFAFCVRGFKPCAISL